MITVGRITNVVDSNGISKVEIKTNTGKKITAYRKQFKETLELLLNQTRKFTIEGSHLVSIEKHLERVI